MYDELLVFFFKCNTSFFLIHKVSIYNRKVCASFSQTWFFTFITLRFPFDMLYFSHSFLLSLNIYVLYQLFFREMIFKKMIFLNIRNLNFQTAKWWLCYLGVLFHWENIAPLYFFMGVFISWRESLLENNDWGSTNFLENNDLGSQYFRRVIINRYTGFTATPLQRVWPGNLLYTMCLPNLLDQESRDFVLGIMKKRSKFSGTCDVFFIIYIYFDSQKYTFKIIKDLEYTSETLRFKITYFL